MKIIKDIDYSLNVYPLSRFPQGGKALLPPWGKVGKGVKNISSDGFHDKFFVLMYIGL